MGRTEPSIGQPPAAFRKDARAKKARATLNKVIPALLSAHPRAKRGIDASELVVDPPAQEPPPSSLSSRANGGPSQQDASPATAATTSTTPRLVLRVTDTLTAARALLVDPGTGAVDRGNGGARVGILNMASALRPGGGFLNGGGAGVAGQEEALCLRTTLLPGLRDAFYRLPETGAIYTPDVLVFRDGGPAARDLAKSHRWFVDCLSAAALRFPDVNVDGNDDDNDDDDDDNDTTGPPRRPRRVYADPADRGRVRRQMRAVLRLAQARRRRRLVLGAWGCAAPHHHPVAEVAAAWRAVLLGAAPARAGKRGGRARPAESWTGIETVVFAIPDTGLADAFASAFGEGLVREEEGDAGDEEGHDGGRDDDEDEDEDDDPEARRMRELRDKIAEMQIRVRQAKSPHLQAGLRSILQTLEAQVPQGHGLAGHPGSDDEDEEDDDDAEKE